MAVLKPKAFLALRKAITGKRATPEELGYERDPKTGRLQKPGTKAFNEKVKFTKEEQKALLKIYKKRLKEDPTEINEQKLVDRKIQLNRKLEILKAQRQRNLEIVERHRKISLKKRQLKDWVKRLDSILAVSRKGSVQGIMEHNFKLLFGKELDVINKKAIYSKAEARKAYEYIHNLYVSEFYSTLHKSFNSKKLGDMSAKDIVSLLNEISSQARKKNINKYNAFRSSFLK